MAAPTQEEVATLYVATFNRAPDEEGLDYWVNDSGLSLAEIAQSFFDQPETQELYPSGTSNESFVTSVYGNLFNREPDQAGLEYWVDELDRGVYSKNLFIQTVINGAQDSADGMDKTILQNKTEVGLYYANNDLNDMNSASVVMQGVSADSSTVAAAKAYIDGQADVIQNPTNPDTSDVIPQVSPNPSPFPHIDTRAPVSPVITSDALSNDITPVLTGTAEKNSNISVSIAGASYSLIAIGGTWSVDTATATPSSGIFELTINGDNAVSVTATDASGNTSDQAVQILVIDTIPPDAPIITSETFSGVPTPVVTGTAEVGSLVSVEIAGATYLIATSDGNWAVDTEIDTPDSGVLTLDVNGDNNISVTATDMAGNTSIASTQVLVIDSTPPTTIITDIAISDDSGRSETDQITKIPEQTITAILSVNLEAGEILSGSTDNGASWLDITDKVTATAISWDNAVLTDTGVIAFKVTDAFDRDGSIATFAYELDMIAPPTPDITSSAESNDATPIITGTAEDNALVTVVIAGATYDVIAAAGGSWSVDTGIAIPDSGVLDINVNGSNSISATATDVAGNTSDVPATQTLIINVADTSVVVFDLLTGQSSDHSGRTFSDTISYTIYVRVDSNISSLTGLTSWNSGVNLGNDDVVILVGNDNSLPVIGSRSFAPTGVNEAFYSLSGEQIRWMSGTDTSFNVANMKFSGQFTRFTSNGVSNEQLWLGSAPSLWGGSTTTTTTVPNSGNVILPLGNVYLRTMPSGVLTSQGLL